MTAASLHSHAGQHRPLAGSASLGRRTCQPGDIVKKRGHLDRVEVIAVTGKWLWVEDDTDRPFTVAADECELVRGGES